MDELNLTTHGLNLTTPSLLFSAISLILLAYTNRFLSYASVVRSLKDRYESNPEADKTTLAQIRNFLIRLRLIRSMQTLGAGSLLFCLIAMFAIYNGWLIMADITFGVGMVLLAASLVICIWEVQISGEALELNLQTIKDYKKDHDPGRGAAFRRLATNRREGDTPRIKEPKEPKHPKERKQPREQQDRGQQQANNQPNRDQRDQRDERAREQSSGGQRPREQRPVRPQREVEPAKDETKPEQQPRPIRQPRERREPRPSVEQGSAASSSETSKQPSAPRQSLPEPRAVELPAVRDAAKPHQ